MPMLIQTFNAGTNKLFDLLLTPFASMNPLWPLSVASLITGVFMLWIYRLTSNQAEIRETKNKIKGHFIEIRLFKDDFRILMSAQKKVLLYNLRYMKCAVKPMLFMIVPIALIVIQLNEWFGYRPLTPGETAIVSVRLYHDGEKALSEVAIAAGEGLTIQTAALRISRTREVNWRIRADKPGRHAVAVKAPGLTFEKGIVVSIEGIARLSPIRSAPSDIWTMLLNPGERPLARNPALDRIEVDYPSRSIDVLGWSGHWLVVYIVLSLVFGLAFKRFFNVEI
jgi:uncharacterized membrane protein (DUF106 family)